MNRLVTFHHRLVSQGAKNILESLLILFFIPFSCLYGLVGWLRNFCYDSNLFPSYRSVLPIVSVGNLSAGGTGKTPVVDWLVKEFQQQGKRPAIVSRGYGGSFSGDVGIVSSGDGISMTAAECGDEPYLLAKRNPDCPVIISRKRINGIKALEKSQTADLIILDDGFQHRAVKRDVDLVLLDSAHPLGNGWSLPAGNLREFPRALKRADFLLMTRSAGEKYSDFMGFQPYISHHQLSDVAVSLTGKSLPVNQLKNLKLLAFAGISNPENFFSALVNCGLSLKEKLSFADHAGYQSQTLEQLQRATADIDILITTEKDAVKLSADMFELPCYYVPMDIVIENSTGLLADLTKRLWS